MKKYKFGDNNQVVILRELQPNGDVRGTSFRLNGKSNLEPAFNQWLSENNTPEPEFTAAELKAKAKAETEAQARSAFNERLWNESPENAALK
ncbi:hypothetical protein LCGC14_1271700 [marine sediment metagenome]|uniref:Uncharacterized protein n=1 Tax=marine sediment metagenome TaxID=412755 RepID=A0A0F9KZP9_9ZZZZ